MQTQSTSTNASANTPLSTTNGSYEEEETGEDAVRRAASVIVNRSSEGDSKRVRRRSRKARSAPLLAGSGLKFHYLVGIVIGFSLLLFPFREKISNKFWKILHPPAPIATTPGVHVAPAEPAPWWFHPEILALGIGFLIWLYLTPGVADKVKTSLGLKKDKENRSRRRHS